MNSIRNRGNVRAFGVVAVAALLMSGIAHGEETKTVQRTVTVYSLSDNSELAAKVEAICSDKAVKLSDKARKACDDKAFPNLTKAKTFRNAGVGAEFNTLARNR